MARKRSRREPKRQNLADRLQRQTQAKIHWLNHKTSLFLVSGLFLFHFLGLVLLFLPPAGIINIQPLIDQDWGLHFYHLQSLEAFWRQDKAFWGYNPYFMAGYPSNTIQDLSVKFFEFAALGLSTVALSPVQWFKIVAFLAMAGVPLLMYFTGHSFFYDHDSRDRIALSSALLGTLYWWNSLPREMFFYGMIGFPIASYLSVWGVSLFYRLALQSPSPGPIHVGLLLFALAILPLHVQSVLTFLPPIAALIVVQPRLITRPLIGWSMAAAALALIGNSAWLIPAFNHRGNDVSLAIVEQLPLFASRDPFTFVIDYLGPKGYWTFRPSFMEKGYRIVLLLLGGIGVWGLIKSERRALGISIACALSVLFFVTYFGAFVAAIKAWQPLRFKVPFDLFLVIGSAYYTSQWLANHRARLVPVLLILGGGAFMINLAQTESAGKLRLRTGIMPELISIVEWIKRETPPAGRVLFEESGDETGFVYDGMYLSSFLPHWTGRQLIGGPINLYNDQHHFAEFHSAKLFKKDIQAISDEELRNYLRLYNIGAIVAFHPASIERLQAIPGLITVDQRVGPIHLMKVNQPLSWFVTGSGDVRATFNRLELSHLTAGEIVLKYHWVDGLSALPATKIEPVMIADDPIPFIKLIDPPSSLVLQAR